MEANGSGAACLRPGCTRPVRSRGLCNADYYAAGRLVGSGELTWGDLEAAGKCTPASTKRGVTEWLREAIPSKEED